MQGSRNLRLKCNYVYIFIFYSKQKFVDSILLLLFLSQFMKVDDQEQLPDTLENAKFTSMAWKNDNKGLFYNVRTTGNFFIIEWL